MSPALLLSLIVAQSPAYPYSPQAQCLSNYGQTVCGFGCVANYGQIKCAQTPGGVCKAEYGRITCWDPPAWAPGVPVAQCLSNYGQTACGYGCVANYGRVKCAQTPAGVCKAEYGQITCWDPQVWVPGAPAAQCVSNYGKTVCGFGCVADYGQVQCAQTPWGRCEARGGRVTCWEPPPGPR